MPVGMLHVEDREIPLSSTDLTKYETGFGDLVAGSLQPVSPVEPVPFIGEHTKAWITTEKLEFRVYVVKLDPVFMGPRRGWNVLGTCDPRKDD